MEKANKKALILNEGFSDNLGDQAIKLNISNLFSDLGYEPSFLYYSNPALKKLPDYNYKPSVTQGSKGKEKDALKGFFVFSFFLVLKSYIKFFSWGWRNRAGIKKNMIENKYDIIVIGGGQLINSARGMRCSIFSIAMYYWTKYAKCYSNSKIYLIGVGSVARFNLVEKKYYSKALSNIEKIWVRDTFSKETLNKQFGVSAEVIPDVAFYNNNTNEYDLRKTVPSKPTAIVGIYNYKEFCDRFNINNTTKEEFYDEWATVVSDFLKEGKEVSLFYSTKGDAFESYFFCEYLKTKHGLEVVVHSTPNLDCLFELYQKTDVVYSARMHALLLALKCGCKSVAYIISQKLSSFNEEYIQSGFDPAVYSERIKTLVGKHFDN